MSSNNVFSVGQRWLSNTESELGLGAVISVDFRAVEILYPATGESRIYTKDNAPLTRLAFEEGDTVKSQDGWELAITDVEVHNDVLIYKGFREDTKEPTRLPETFLDHHIKLNQPEKRLFNGQLDAPKWFDLRLASTQYLHQRAKSSTIGLTGARIELIPHQIHIASEVGQRHAPRVLLADEVGLGKTIEAALIIHQQIMTGKASRVLIVVPNSLVHQWLVEMLRRVNLAFAIFDESRCEALTEELDNPFDNDQLVLCSLDFLRDNPERQAQALDTSWDLLVVDEAHHLAWSKDVPSQEYLLVEQLAECIPGVLLLTATPDQLGHESHFARLRLLDSARFHDYETFIEEESRYSELADAVSPLLDDQPITNNQRQLLVALAPEIMAHHGDLDTPDQRQSLLRQLIDCHGTGRILFRNRRAGIEGFPQRVLHQHTLPLPSEYQPLTTGTDLTLALYPERDASLVDSWTQIDPRIDWLLDFLPQVKPAKVLLICASDTSVQQLAEAIRIRSGIRHAVFHKGMSIVERDKAAHYFAQEEDGAQVLLCSEIGSEGRNFQFANHLVLFDLPLTPDLLEQRIGRLDRIGQKNDVNIHVPVFDNTAQAVLAQWYADGLDAFNQTCPTGSAVFEAVKTNLIGTLLHPTDTALIDNLVSESAAINDQLKHQLEQGRDRLLELNASGSGQVDQLLEDIVAIDSSIELQRFMGRLLDALGVAQEEKGNDCFILKPTERMVSHLPGLDPEGMTVTYRRRIATTLEHVHFLSWDHPLVHNAIDMVLTDTLGKASVGFIADKSLPKGAYWLETSYILAAKAPSALQLTRFLPSTPIRLCIDAQGNPVDLDFELAKGPGKKISHQLAQALQQPIALSLEKAQRLAHGKANEILSDALSTMHDSLGQECQRLRDLQTQNPSVRDEEIEFIELQIKALDKVLQQADTQLDSLRIVVNNP